MRATTYDDEMDLIRGSLALLHVARMERSAMRDLVHDAMIPYCAALHTSYITTLRKSCRARGCPSGLAESRLRARPITNLTTRGGC